MKRCPRRFSSTNRVCNGPMEPLFGGEYRCLDCGYRVFDELPTFNFRDDEQSKHAVDSNRRYRGKGSTVPCAVVGCDNSMVAGAEMCGKCQRYLRHYNKYKSHRFPPPVEKIDGVWVKRIARV